MTFSVAELFIIAVASFLTGCGVAAFTIGLYRHGKRHERPYVSQLHPTKYR